MNTDEERKDRVTEAIIGCAMRVSNTLGAGFLEKVYENALAYEITQTGLKVDQQAPLTVRYRGVVVGEYAADLLVGGRVIVELKAVQALDGIHQAQLMNYLRATGIKTGLLLNFGTPRLQIKRIVF